MSKTIPSRYAPRLLRLEPAAAYVGMGRTKFLDLVDAGRMPKPLHIDGVRAWDRQALDAAVDDLSTTAGSDDDGGRQNSFDQVLAGR